VLATLFGELLFHHSARKVHNTTTSSSEHSTPSSPPQDKQTKSHTQSSDVVVMDDIFCLKFDMKVHLHITRACMKHILSRNSTLGVSNTKTDKTERPTEDRLLSEVKHNLDKDLDKKDKFVVTVDPLHTSKPTEGQDVAFTCGHYFARKAFREEILPQFKEKLSAFSTGLPFTASLMVADYHQPTIALACPVCVYNDLRKKQKIPLEKWEL